MNIEVEVERLYEINQCLQIRQFSDHHNTELAYTGLVPNNVNTTLLYLNLSTCIASRCFSYLTQCIGNRALLYLNYFKVDFSQGYSFSATGFLIVYFTSFYLNSLNCPLLNWRRLFFRSLFDLWFYFFFLPYAWNLRVVMELWRCIKLRYAIWYGKVFKTGRKKLRGKGISGMGNFGK